MSFSDYISSVARYAVFYTECIMTLTVHSW